MARSWCKEERAYIVQRITELRDACLRLERLGYFDAARTNLNRLNLLRLDLELHEVKQASDALQGIVAE